MDRAYIGKTWQLHVIGIDKEAKIKYISVPEKEKKNILKNIDKYPEKNIENRCVLVEVLKGNY